MTLCGRPRINGDDDDDDDESRVKLSLRLVHQRHEDVWGGVEF